MNAGRSVGSSLSHGPSGGNPPKWVVDPSRLSVPVLRPTLVVRPALFERLRDGLTQRRLLTLVSAGAGYGKTTTIAGWLVRSERKFAWASLEPSDNDPVRFLNLFVAAAQQIDPRIGRGAEATLSLPQLPPPGQLGELVARDIQAAGAPFVLVLDDYHYVQDRYVHDFIQTLLDRVHPPFHLVLLTREDPPLTLSRWRVRNLITELRAADLCLNTDESERFLNDCMGLDLNTEAASALTVRTEGWVAGLQLAALSLQGLTAEQVNARIRAFGGSHRFVIDYLLDEVLRRISPGLDEFLRQTSVLDRFCPSLCDAVTGRSDSAALLLELTRENLFLIPLDTEDDWYRYHRLFADYMATGLPEADARSIHARAAHWFESSGDLINAVRHALSAHDVLHAESLIGRVAPDMLREGEIRTLLGWLRKIPDDRLLADCDLASYMAWCLFLTGDPGGSVFFERLEMQSDLMAVPRSRGALLALKVLQPMEDRETALRMAEESVRLTAGTSPLFHVGALLSLGQILAGRGHAAAAESTFAQARQAATAYGHTFSAAVAVANEALNKLWQGKRREALSLCLEASELYTDNWGNPFPIAGIVFLPLGMTYAESNELDRASQVLTQGIEFCRKLGLAHMCGPGEWMLATLYACSGKPELAAQVIASTRTLAAQTGQIGLSRFLDSLEANIDLAQGRTDTAMAWITSIDSGSAPRPESLSVLSQMAYARSLTALGRSEEAAVILEDMERSASADGRLGHLIRIHLLQTESCRAMGRKERSLDCFHSALKLAAARDMVLPFVEHPRLVDLLGDAYQDAPAFVDRLVQAMGVQCPHETTAVAFPGAEPLSEREIEIIRLVARGLSNQDIADRLFITVGTTKWHLSNILGKLGARNRVEASERARELGLI